MANHRSRSQRKCRSRMVDMVVVTAGAVGMVIPEGTEVVGMVVVAGTEEGQGRRRSPPDRLTRHTVRRRRRPRRSLRHTVSSLPVVLTYDVLD